MKDELGDRMKGYERTSRPYLERKTPVIVRVDGRSFHTYTRNLTKPFDFGLIETMLVAATETARDMQGFRLGYVQSDEATFLLTDTANAFTEPWFGYNLNKVVSLSASMFTAHFNAASPYGLATFDSRAFNVPDEDVPNVFVWRQKDWKRNWINMLARSQFSTKQLQYKRVGDMCEMLVCNGVNADDQPDVVKYGTFLLPDGERIHAYKTYEEVRVLAEREVSPVSATDCQTAVR